MYFKDFTIFKYRLNCVKFILFKTYYKKTKKNYESSQNMI